MLFVFANLSILSVGSEPMDRKQMRGTRGSLSAHMPSMSRITPSAYYNNNNNIITVVVVVIIIKKGSYLVQ